MNNLDEFKEAIKKAKENKGIQEGLQFEFEGVEPGSWSDFLIRTDVGQAIAQNQQVNFKDSYEKSTRGAFIKIDDETFAKIRLTGNERSSACGVSVNFIPREQLRKSITYELINPEQIEQYLDEILKLKNFDAENIRLGMLEESERDAENLILKHGIPKSREQIEHILQNENVSRDGCLLTYASMLCEQTPEGNEYVDELITLSMKNCGEEHIDRIVSDFNTIEISINDRSERKYNRDPSAKGISFAKFVGGAKITKGQMPLNFKTRKRMLLNMYKGMISNPNINLKQMILLLTGNDYEYEGVTEEFINAKADALYETLKSGECRFSAEELISGTSTQSKREEIKKMLDAAEQRLKLKNDKTITLSDATKNALKSRTTIDETREVKTVEDYELNPENIRIGEEKNG